MADRKKYYWIKLKTDFFDQDTIDFLMGQENGAEYVVIYQMLMLKTAQQGGYLGTKMAEVMVPYDIKKIVRDTKYFDYDTVTIALELFKKLGLVYEESNHILKLAGAEQLVGSESKWAEKKRIYRDSQRTIQGQIEDNVRQEIDIDKEIEKEKDIEIDIDTDKKKKKKSAKADLNGMIDSFTENEELQNALKAFVQMRSFIKKPLTEYGLKLLLNKLSKIGRTDAEKIAIVNRSVEHNWQGFFEIKEETSYQKSAQPEKKYDQNGYESEEEFMKMFYGK